MKEVGPGELLELAASRSIGIEGGCVRVCRSMKKRCCSGGVKRLQVHRVVEASWSSTSHRPTSPLFGATILSWAFKNSSANGKRWIRSVSSPPRDNVDITDQSQQPGSTDATQVHPSQLAVQSWQAPARLLVFFEPA